MAGRDEQIKKDVVDQLYWDGRVDASDIRITVENGEVTLEGTVPDYTALQAAETDSWSVRDVFKVSNRLRIRYPEPMTAPPDAEIKFNIENLLRWNPIVDEKKVRVAVERGAVRLEGTVDAYWKKVRAEEAAYNVQGVLEVENDLAVVPTADTLDEAVAESIMEALDRNIFVDAGAVDVQVENGRATLSGVLPNWTAYRAAMDIARHTEGVTAVVNNLSVR